MATRADTPRPVHADKLVLPPATREFRSSSGRFVFSVSSADHWKSRVGQARLYAAAGSERTLLWTVALPQERGPRHVLVADSGAVVLMDEWINVPSRYALMLLSPQGKQLVHYGIDALVELLGVSRRAVAEQGRLGIWMSSTPSFSADASTVTFRSAGRQLVLRLADGQLTAID